MSDSGRYTFYFNKFDAGTSEDSFASMEEFCEIETNKPLTQPKSKFNIVVTILDGAAKTK